MIASATERERRLRFCSSVSSTGSGLLSMSTSSGQGSCDQAPCNVLDQENREQAEQINDRIGEHLPGGGGGARTFGRGPHPPCERNHQRTGDERRDAVGEPGV